MAADDEKVLQVRDLRVHFPTEEGVVKAVDGLSFDVGRGEIVGIVGEYGFRRVGGGLLVAHGDVLIEIPKAERAAIASAFRQARQASQQRECSQAWPVWSVPNGSRAS